MDGQEVTLWRLRCIEAIRKELSVWSRTGGAWPDVPRFSHKKTEEREIATAIRSEH
jgi:hypothetical protein